MSLILFLQASYDAHSGVAGGQQVMAQAVDSLSPSWETYIELLPPGFDLAWALLFLQAFREWNSRQEICFILYPSVFQIDVLNRFLKTKVHWTRSDSDVIISVIFIHI